MFDAARRLLRSATRASVARRSGPSRGHTILVGIVGVLFVATGARARESSADAGNPTPSDTVVLRAPADGGSPRSAANLVRTSANRYRLSAEQSETHDGVVIGQFMVEAANNAATPQTVTLDLAGAPNRYCYYRIPSGAWRRTEVGANGTSLQLSVPPGVTRIATVPWFTYGEYVAYVDSLTDSRVTKEVAFTDEGGKFKIYRLRVTNPTGVKDKLKICFGKAQHAHETSAFFMTQGIIEWLLSGDPAANLDNIVWTFYPCADPKAAYHHLNYSEVEKETYDTGKPGQASYYNDIAAGHHHLIQITHMWNNEGHNLEHESYEYWDPTGGLDRHRDLSGRRAGFAALPRLDGVLAALVRVGDGHLLAPQRAEMAAAWRRRADAQRNLLLRQGQRRRRGREPAAAGQGVGPGRQPGVPAIPEGEPLLDLVAPVRRRRCHRRGAPAQAGAYAAGDAHARSRARCR